MLDFFSKLGSSSHSGVILSVLGPIKTKDSIKKLKETVTEAIDFKQKLTENLNFLITVTSNQ